VTKVDRKKGGREWGDSLKKGGLSILIVGAVVGFVAAALGMRSEIVQFCVAASVAGASMRISGQYLSTADREKFQKELRNSTWVLVIVGILAFAGIILSWAFSIDP